ELYGLALVSLLYSLQSASGTGKGTASSSLFIPLFFPGTWSPSKYLLFRRPVRTQYHFKKASRKLALWGLASAILK
ncbi:hypothetical protein BDZ97DRAFT_1799646, partial [Flammula alnicola]